MPIARTFLDWRQPALPAIAEYLAGRFLRGTTLDLDNVVLALPGGRAARRLTEELVRLCEERCLTLQPGAHCTVGALPEYLYESKRPFATDLVQQLAWVRALKETDHDCCRQLTARLPDEEDHAGWMDLGALLQRQHRELAADALDFGLVAQRGRQMPGFHDEQRWQLLSRIQQKYLQILDGLELWDLQTARLYAIQHQLCRTDKQIILVATTDMTMAMRHMLDQVSQQVTAIVHAPADLADHFDQHGCLQPDRWLDELVGISAQQIHTVEGPADQAEEVVRCIADLDGRYRADQIVIGVLDEQLVPQLLRRLKQAHLPARWVVGKTVGETAPFRLLEAAASYLERSQYLDFASLARHPDLAPWLAARHIAPDWLAALDDYYNDHLALRLGEWLGQDDRAEKLRHVVSAIHEVLQPLRGAQRPLPQWAPLIAQLLRAFYGQRCFDLDLLHDQYTFKALEHLREGLLLQQQVPIDIAPHLSAAEAIRQLLSQVQGNQLPSPHEDDQIELLGWLELPLDTAPALIVTALNEGIVPTSVNSDLFLPNALRQQLELVDNRRRYARDAYALSVLLASRDELSLISARFTADHDPLLPSRLIFATDPVSMAERARHFFCGGEQDASAPALIHVTSGAGEPSRIVVPQPLPLSTPITSINVTAFRSYLECPYRFYLRHVLHLQSIDDRCEELGPAAFGTLIHDVLSAFGKEEIHTSTDPDKIVRFLNHTLNKLTTARYGQEHLPAVSVQLVQARQRLQAFAAWQAQWAAQGWVIVHTETSGGEQPARLNVDSGTSVILQGRIDRIDRKDDQWAVFDYKTGDTARSPDETHLKSGEWIDLQLPLYLQLARSLGIESVPQLGYINLPKELQRVGALLATWDEEALEQAETIALDVASKIVAGEFWPPTRPPAASLTEFASICQEHAFRPHLEARVNGGQA